MKKKFTFIDLFAGCGGLSEGFMASGFFEPLAHVEWELPMVKTLRNRLVTKWNESEQEANNKVVYFDIQKTDELINGNWSEDSLKIYGKENSELAKGGLKNMIGERDVDIIIGGPPCQAYSIHGRATDPNSMSDDYRNYLFESFVKVVMEFQPKIFVFENVTGLLSARPGGTPVVDRIHKAFSEIGYKILRPEEFSNAVYDVVEYQVPQHRERVILFGVREDISIDLSCLYNALSNEKSASRHKTVRDAIGKLAPIYPLPEVIKEKNRYISHHAPSTTDAMHQPRHCSPRDIQVITSWINNGMNRCSRQEAIDFYKRITGCDTLYVKYRNLEWNKPSPTVVAHLQKDGFMFIHPDVEQARFITVREAACLMSFPIDFEFIGSRAYCYKMIGNAVPVNFAKAIANAVAVNLKTQISNGVKGDISPLLCPTICKRNPQKINVLIACEESQTVCKEFRKLGFNAYSCDILGCSGNHPEWHLKCDVLGVIKNKRGTLENGEEFVLDGEWDLMIAHPPCTYLSVSGARWYYHPDDKDLPIEQRRPHPHFPQRAQDRQEGIDFFLALANSNIPRIAVENPVGIMSKIFRKPDQIVQPYWFGDEATKTTCLWLKNLPGLQPTKIVGKGSRVVLSSGKSLPKWYSDSFNTKISTEMRRTLRSKTFQGFAEAMATQWGEVLKNDEII